MKLRDTLVLLKEECHLLNSGAVSTEPVAALHVFHPLVLISQPPVTGLLHRKPPEN